jgi:phospholipid transport system transporter-binding protein
MSEQATLTRFKRGEDHSYFAIEGPLTFSTVVKLWEQSLVLLKNEPRVTIDLKAVTRSDSAGLALLTAWTREARISNHPLYFVDVPTQLWAMAKVSGLEAILPMEPLNHSHTRS